MTQIYDALILSMHKFLVGAGYFFFVSDKTVEQLPFLRDKEKVKCIKAIYE